MYVKTIAFLLVAVAAVAIAAPKGNEVDSTRLRFTVSGRDLKDKHRVLALAPYVEIYYTQDDEDGETKLGRSETLTNTRDPDWSDIFAFEFVRNKGQKWHFKVFDDDHLHEQSTEGEAWVKVSDFVDSDENMQVNLSKKGFLIIKRA